MLQKLRQSSRKYPEDKLSENREVQQGRELSLLVLRNPLPGTVYTYLTGSTENSIM